MRPAADVFHLAIPVRDLDETLRFYLDGIGAKLARRYDDRVTFNFFGDQLVCHLAPDDVPLAQGEIRLYPRHFGVTFRERGDFDRLVDLVRRRGLPVLAGPSTRFGGSPEEHLTLALTDPSGNVLEFKHYADPRLMY